MKTMGSRTRPLLLVLGVGALLASVATFATHFTAKEGLNETSLCTTRTKVQNSREFSEMRALPKSKILTRPEVEFYSIEASPNKFELGFISENHFLVEARVELRPQLGELSIQLASSNCAIDSAASSNSAVLMLEHLYGAVLASSVISTFEMAMCNDAGTCTTRLPAGTSQYAALRDLAVLRAEKITALPDGVQYRKWRSLEIVDGKESHDTVSARILSPTGTAVGHDVAFSRLPHLGCFAKTDDAGLAKCELVDYHGDNGHERENDIERFTATVTGGTEADAVVLPTARTFAN